MLAQIALFSITSLVGGTSGGEISNPFSRSVVYFIEGMYSLMCRLSAAYLHIRV